MLLTNTTVEEVIPITSCPFDLYVNSLLIPTNSLDKSSNTWFL